MTNFRPAKPQRIRKQRLRLAVVAILGVCGGFAFAAIWLASALWQMLVGR